MVLPPRVHCGNDSWQTLLQFFELLNWHVNLFWEETYIWCWSFQNDLLSNFQMITITKSTPTDPVSLFSSHLIWWYLKIMMAGRGIGTLMLLMWIDCYFNILVLAELPRDAFSLIYVWIYSFFLFTHICLSATLSHTNTHKHNTFSHKHTNLPHLSALTF